MKSYRSTFAKGKRSRNKASVGEPLDGSLRFMDLLTETFSMLKCHIYIYIYRYIIYVNLSNNPHTVNVTIVALPSN